MAATTSQPANPAAADVAVVSPWRRFAAEFAESRLALLGLGMLLAVVLVSALRAGVFFIATSASSIAEKVSLCGGNAPNLMVRSIAAHRGVRMPGFFGYMGWAALLLLPLFALVTRVFFR